MYAPAAIELQRSTSQGFFLERGIARFLRNSRCSGLSASSLCNHVTSASCSVGSPHPLVRATRLVDVPFGIAECFEISSTEGGRPWNTCGPSSCPELQGESRLCHHRYFSRGVTQSIGASGHFRLPQSYLAVACLRGANIRLSGGEVLLERQNN